MGTILVTGSTDGIGDPGATVSGVLFHDRRPVRFTEPRTTPPCRTRSCSAAPP
jgi:hypothetical protein